jgi:hypothetical protein
MKVLLLVLSLSLAGCGGGGDQAAEEDEETIFDPLVSTIDKAKAVEEITLQTKDDLDKAIEEADPDR